jgi:beta-galactosidase
MRSTCFILLFILAIAPPSLHAQQKTRLIHNWQFVKQDLGGIWEAVRPVAKGAPESTPLWTEITLLVPHTTIITKSISQRANTAAF